MRKKSSRGAVTVFVTLLLIPAILIGGTGVDISRIYAARSAAKDANQLAANALLTEYDALLQDLYGLYAVIGDDEKLTEMVDEYVKLSLFGREEADAAPYQVKLLSGRESTSAATGMDPLSNKAILRRQIEEYAKYRVPVAVVSDILDRLQNSETQEMSANNEAAAKKITVDENTEAVLKIYKAVMEKASAILAGYEQDERAIFSSINERISEINYQLNQLKNIRDAYDSETDTDKKADLEAHFKAVLENISSCTIAGWVGSNWQAGDYDEEGNFIVGEWGEPRYVHYEESIENMQTHGIEKLQSYGAQLDELVELCKEADSAKDELEASIQTLEAQLNSGECTPELVENMRKEIDDIKQLLTFNFTELGTQMRVEGNDYIAQKGVAQIEGIRGYGDAGSTYAVMSFQELGRLPTSNIIAIDFNEKKTFTPDLTDELMRLVRAPAKICIRREGETFPPFSSVSEAHRKCYDLVMNSDFKVKSAEEALSSEEQKGKGSFTQLFKKMKDLWSGLTDYDPTPGQKSYTDPNNGWAFSLKSRGLEMDFGLSDFAPNDSDEGGMRGTIKTFTNLVSGKSSLLDVFGNALSNGANRVLLVGYATQMFSDWSYKCVYKDKDAPLSLTGQPIDASNNYFYNSEIEYILNGSLTASDNLAKITLTILGLRFLANFASTYILHDLNLEIAGIKAAVSAIPFAGGVLSFLVRPLYALGESVWDVSMLRTGHGVVLLKTAEEDWSFSLAGIARMVIDSVADVDAEAEKEKGMIYGDYLIVFMLLSEPDVLASRIGDLIALNVGLRKSGGDASSVEMLDMSKARTTFSVKTTTDLRFIFLSMLLAQRGVDGVVPPSTFPISVTDYRGY